MVKKIGLKRRIAPTEPNWLLEVIRESTSDPRLNKKTPRRKRVWVLIVSYRIPGMGVALNIRKRKSLCKRMFEKLNPKQVLQSRCPPEGEPICGFHDDLDEPASLRRLHDQLKIAVIENFEAFLGTDLGKKIQERRTFSDNLTLLLRRLQAL
ncbi:hypothetical protein [Candidatus Mycoplasma haematominutum]|uniref:Uncharacterized protein n=1 Tax=Candidatus Mycoplasma haematominutum 'Birmingham 1' TaxID=1116213 RepID=G8C384_9MOLU|nr:hypothetical protein [Candidatus Mycoplasma haematominutum]CCE66782.1 hypothetical protein MHM_02640 [Candidatus Mycoplasma haematominutum 'Birmingham 1']